MSDGRPIVKTATEARQGRTSGVVRWVLGISLTLAIGARYRGCSASSPSRAVHVPG